MYYNYLGVCMSQLFQVEKIIDFHFKFDNFELTCVAPVTLEKTKNIFNKFLFNYWVGFTCSFTSY